MQITVESYDRYTGTSMATPHIAAIAALIRQANPAWTPFDVKVALSNTAKVLDKKRLTYSHKDLDVFNLTKRHIQLSLLMHLIKQHLAVKK